MSEPRRRVVLIDDDAEIRALVERVLGASGYDVASLGEPLQAVEFVRGQRPDVVLCDISMPGLDGYGVVRALQGDPDTARYPVVFLTANRDFAARVQAFRFGVVDYVTKPFTRDMLLRKLERALALTEHRSGVLTGEGGALLAGAREDSRSGVLSLAASGQNPQFTDEEPGQQPDPDAKTQRDEIDVHSDGPVRLIPLIVSPGRGGQHGVSRRAAASPLFR